MLNLQSSPQGPKINNSSGAVGALQASEFNDFDSEIQQNVIESGQIFNITKTPYQIPRAIILKAMSGSSWQEDIPSASANLSNLIPFNAQTLIVFDIGLVTGNIITLTINNTVIGPISFTTSNVNTFGLIKAAIAAAFPSATVNYNNNISGSFNYISIYQSGTAFTVNSIVFTGTGVTTPNPQASYGMTTPDSYAEMDGCVISFNKSIANTTTTPQINISTGTPNNTVSSMLGAITVTQIGGAALPIGAMSGLCEVRFNLALNNGQGYWELLYSDGLSLQRSNPTNYFMNGSFQVAQRGVTFTIAASPTYTLDRIKELYTTLPSTSMIVTQGSLAPGTADELPLLNEGCKNYIRSTVSGTNSPSATDYYKKQQYIENGAVMLGGGRQVTITFKARSSISQKIGIGIQQYYGTGGSPSANTVLTGTVISLGTTFAQYSYTFTTTSLSGITLGTNNDNAMIIEFYQMWGSTVNSANLGASATTSQAHASGTMDITEIRVNTGNLALPFNPIPYAIELDQCKRYTMTLANAMGGGVLSIVFSRAVVFSSNLIEFPLNISTMRTGNPIATFGAEGTDWVVTTINNGGLPQTGFTLGMGLNNVLAQKFSHGLTDGALETLSANNYLNADY